MHDETYKKLFAFPRMVEDLLRGFAAGPRADDIDFSTLPIWRVWPRRAIGSCGPPTATSWSLG